MVGVHVCKSIVMDRAVMAFVYGQTFESRKKTKSPVVEKLKSKGVLDAHSKMECFAIMSISYTTVLAVQMFVYMPALSF